MKWYQLKEHAAGKKRLMVLWYVYKFFGKKVLKFLVFFITFFVFLGAHEPRKYSKKYLTIAGLEPSLCNQFKHILEYSFSLVDRMEVFAGLFNPADIIFAGRCDKLRFEEDLKNGIFIICSHLGNIDIMRSFLFTNPGKHVNVFLSDEQCKKFNDFIKHIKIKTAVCTYPVEDININTSIEIKEKIMNGEVVIMAGDRISKNSTNSYISFLGQKVQLPIGTFRFAYIMDCPVYFVCALRENNKYKIFLKKFVSVGNKQETIKKMQEEYAAFLENLIPQFPYQFFHFYDFFEQENNNGIGHTA